MADKPTVGSIVPLLYNHRQEIVTHAVAVPSRASNSSLTSAELGTGLSVWAGMIREEYLTQLKDWGKVSKVYAEMADDAVIGALLESIKMPLLATRFEVVPASESAKDKAAAEFLEENLFIGMEWEEHVEEALSFIEYGFALSEIVLEKRADGKLWIRTLLPVGQETIESWSNWDDVGRPQTVVQRIRTATESSRGQLNSAAMAKMLHFVFAGRKRNPQGKSLLRSLYRPWYFKKNLETLEAIGAERDVGNAPVATLGEGYYSDEDITNLKNALEGFRLDEAAYMILPTGIELDAYGGGSKTYDIRTMIRDWQHLIRQRFFADFLAMGSEEVGTQSLARELNTFFAVALRSIQTKMIDVWNRQLIPYLFKFNDFGVEKLPVLAWGVPGQRNMQELAQSITTLIQGGVLTNNEDLEQFVRATLNLPVLTGPRDVIDTEKQQDPKKSTSNKPQDNATKNAEFDEPSVLKSIIKAVKKLRKSIVDISLEDLLNLVDQNTLTDDEALSAAQGIEKMRKMRNLPPLD